MSTITLLKKIGASDLLGKVSQVVKNDFEIGERKLAYGVAGICDKIENGTSTYGEWVRFIGEFNATNYLTGEVFQSAKTHVPTVLESALLSGIESFKGAVKELQHSTVTSLTQEIEFAFTVDIVRKPDDEKGGVSYEYICTPRTEVKGNNRIAHLASALPPVTPQTAIAAPVAEETTPKAKAKAKA